MILNYYFALFCFWNTVMYRLTTGVQTGIPADRRGLMLCKDSKARGSSTPLALEAFLSLPKAQNARIVWEIQLPVSPGKPEITLLTPFWHSEPCRGSTQTHVASERLKKASGVSVLEVWGCDLLTSGGRRICDLSLAGRLLRGAHLYFKKIYYRIAAT